MVNDQRKINKMQKLLEQLKMLKKEIVIALVIILILLSSGCVKTVESNSFCLWFTPVSLLENEIESLSEVSLRQIDRVNNEFNEQCKN